MRSSKLQNIIQLITFIIIMGYLSNHPIFAGSSLILSIILIAIIGIPHGANDHLLFFNLFQNRFKENGKSGRLFYFTYLGLIILYSVCWYFMPVFSLGLFLLISFYHFGQSNLYAFPFQSKIIKLISILISGIFVLMTPIFAHLETSLPIIDSLSQNSKIIEISYEQGRQISVWLGIMMFMYWLLLIITKQLIFKKGILEMLNVILLFGLYFYTPLWIGFAVYFTLWHAIPSIEDQINFFKTRRSNYHLGNYIKEILPYTLLALSGLAIVLELSGEYITQNQGIALLFAFIAVITLPHMIMMDILYQQIGENNNLMNR
jgi:Brp/Blh family beta-carotene 15,15'-monooxygenase